MPLPTATPLGAVAREVAGISTGRWTLAMSAKEEHGSELYGGDVTAVGGCVYLATVGRNRASVYGVADSGELDLLQAWVDEDAEECYYTAAFTYEAATGDTWLAVAGRRGIIKVLNVTGGATTWLTGHGNEVNQVAWHPVTRHLCLSASKDESIRLWNARSRVLIAIFAGRGGHRYDVLALAVHTSGAAFLSGGMDTSVKLWSLAEPALLDAIAASEAYDPAAAHRPFKTQLVHQPLFSTMKVHGDYVDYVAFVGDAILSKCAGACSHKMVLWVPNVGGEPDGVLVLAEYVLRDCDSWFVKGAVHPSRAAIAMGAMHGRVRLFPIMAEVRPGATAAAAAAATRTAAASVATVPGAAAAAAAATVATDAPSLSPAAVDAVARYMLGRVGLAPPAWATPGALLGAVPELLAAPPPGSGLPPVAPLPPDAAPPSKRARVDDGEAGGGEGGGGGGGGGDGGGADDVVDVSLPAAAGGPGAGATGSGSVALPVDAYVADPTTPLIQPRQTLTHTAARAQARNVLFSPSGASLFVLCDDATIWHWRSTGPPPAFRR